jgi:hypothetical protein
MNFLLPSLLHALTTPDGSDGALLSTRRKSHLIEAEWYVRLAAEGDKERRKEHRTADSAHHPFRTR